MNQGAEMSHEPNLRELLQQEAILVMEILESEGEIYPELENALKASEIDVTKKRCLRLCETVFSLRAILGGPRRGESEVARMEDICTTYKRVKVELDKTKVLESYKTGTELLKTSLEQQFEFKEGISLTCLSNLQSRKEIHAKPPKALSGES
jgi:hypothetical protein